MDITTDRGAMKKKHGVPLKPWYAVNPEKCKATVIKLVWARFKYCFNIKLG